MRDRPGDLNVGHDRTPTHGFVRDNITFTTPRAILGRRSGGPSLRTRSVAFVTAVSLSLVLSSVSFVAPAFAHGSSRYAGFNVQNTYRPSAYCQYYFMHGDYNGPYVRVNQDWSGCRGITEVRVTGCEGWNCPTSPTVATSQHDVWVTSFLPSNFGPIYSHNGQTYCTSSNCSNYAYTLYHNTMT